MESILLDIFQPIQRMMFYLSVPVVFGGMLLAPILYYRSTPERAGAIYYYLSMIPGAAVWFYSAVVLLDLFGLFWFLLAAVFLLVGVIPAAVILTAIAGLWFYTAEIIIGVAIAYGVKVFGAFINRKMERRLDREPAEMQHSA